MEIKGVLAGIDGSPGAARAVAWAAADAAGRGAPLSLCFVAPADGMSDPVIPRRHGGEVLDDAWRALAAEWPRLVIRRELAEGHPSTELRRRTAAHEVVVVGSHGTANLPGMPIGSVAGFLVAHAFCPVVVVPPDRVDPDAPVLVGVDGSTLNEAAVEFSFAAAERTGVPLLALSSTDGGRHLADTAGLSLGFWSEKYPAVPVEFRIVPGPPAAELVATSPAASLTVVGSRGHGGVSGLLLGSVSEPVSRQARSPVAVVHPFTRR